MNNNMSNLGLSSNLDFYSSLMKSLKSMNAINNQLHGLSNISEILKQQSFKQNLGISTAIGLSAIQNMHHYNNVNKQINPFLPLSTQLSQIVKQQENFAKSIPALPNLSLSDSILKSIETLKRQTIPDFSKALSSIALIKNQQSQIYESLPKYLSNLLDFYLRQRIDDDDDEVDRIEDDIKNISSKLTEITENQKVTKEDIAFINATLQKGGTSAFVYFIIQIVLAILLAFNSSSTKQSHTTITINNYEQKEIEKGFSETLRLLCLETRKAKVNTNLRSKPNSKSAKIGLVSSGQIVLVQEINHKWIRIVYQDDEYMIQSGWVFKKNFEKTNHSH